MCKIVAIWRYRNAAGIVLAADFSMLRTSLIAFTASVASSWLPCVGMMTRSARTHGVAAQQRRGAFKVHDDESGLPRRLLDLVHDRVLGHLQA